MLTQLENQQVIVHRIPIAEIFSPAPISVISVHQW
jgi:hypothetical protein